MSYAIKIDNLSKRYRISHITQTGSLRDLVDSFKRKIFSNPLRKKVSDLDQPVEIFEEFWALKDVSLET